MLISALGFSQNTFKLHGKVKADDSDSRAIKIVVTKNGAPFTTFKPDGSGKYSFNVDYNNVYVVSFEKNGYVTKRVEVNTMVTDKVLEDNSYKYKWKVDVGLFKEYEGIDFSFFEKPIQKIYFVDKSDKFDYDNRYAKQIEKELKALIAEVEKKKAEEAKKAELAKQQKLEAEKKAELARQQKIQEDKKRQAEEAKNARKEVAEKPTPPVKKPKPTYTQPKRTPPIVVKTVDNRVFSTETFSDANKQIIYVTVVSDKKVNVYRKVIWNWGAVYYFKNSENISKSIFFEETYND